jgi:hypothetical protein
MSDDHTAIIPAESVEVVESCDSDDMLHPMVKAMMTRQDFGPDELAKLMDMQERHEDRVAEKLFNSARSNLKKSLPKTIRHNKKGNRARYSDLPQIMREIDDALDEHGFSISWESGEDGRKQSVTCVLTHRDGHEKRYTRKSVADPVKGLTSAQSDQACVTYLKRQTVLQAIGKATDEPDADEPPKPVPTTVNKNRNLRVASKLRREHGIPASEVEEYLSKPIAEWTSTDIDRIPGWLEERGGS